MQDIEPFYGWLGHYQNEQDPYSPFHEVEHNEFFYDRSVYNYLAHPLWDHIESESLLIKILYADYDRGFAVIELFGVWNDLFENDFKLLCENCLDILVDNGINKLIFIAENILSIYVDEDDYYQALHENIEDGWLCLIRPREHVREDLLEYHLDQYFFWSEQLDQIQWRKLKPWQLFLRVEEKMSRILG